MPQFGRIEANEWYTQKYSGHGVVLAHITGQILAAEISADKKILDVFAKKRHWKLSGGKWFANPVLALGKDVLPT